MRTTFVLAALLLPFASAAPIVEQIENGSFEAWSDGVPDGWHLAFGTATRSDFAHEGDSAVFLLPDADGWSGLVQVVEFPPHVQAVPLARYDVWLALGGGPARVEVHWHGIGGLVRTDTMTSSGPGSYRVGGFWMEAPVDPAKGRVATGFSVVVSALTPAGTYVDAVTAGVSEYQI